MVEISNSTRKYKIIYRRIYEYILINRMKNKRNMRVSRLQRIVCVIVDVEKQLDCQLF